ncbi:uncharacterized protein LOC143284648 [Babylonia areolata]|uniref:uncharacterized protein LOC143284648 n=1 Tax=Babylonia areolata TaxID=304850 RepID=UPI003FD54F05
MASRIASIHPTPLTTLAFASVVFHLALGLTCPENRSPVLNDKVAESEVVLQGRLRRQVEVENKPDQGYTAEVEVQCVFKGGPVASFIIVMVTDQERSCMAGLEKNISLIYLNRNKVKDQSKTYLPTFTPDPAQRSYLDELKFACGLQVELPTGVPKSDVCNPDRFVQDYDPEECATQISPSSGSSAVTPFATALSGACILALWLFR